MSARLRRAFSNCLLALAHRFSEAPVIRRGERFNDRSITSVPPLRP
ncbi:hypothetical protein [Congregicoccus parvus]